MRCDGIKELLWAYYSKDVLTQDENAEVESHLAVCAECRKEASEIENIMTALHSLPEEELPDGYHESLMEKLAQEAKVVPLPVKKKPQYKWKQLSLVAAAALVVVAVGGMQGVWQSSKPLTGQVQEQGDVSEVLEQEPVIASDSEGAMVEQEASAVAKPEVQNKLPAKVDQGAPVEQAETRKAAVERESVKRVEDLPMVMSIAEDTVGNAVPDENVRALRAATGGAMPEPTEVAAEEEVILTVASVEGVIQKIRDAAFALGGHELYNGVEDAITVSVQKVKVESFYDTLETYGEMRTLKEKTEGEDQVTIAVTLEVKK